MELITFDSVAKAQNPAKKHVGEAKRRQDAQNRAAAAKAAEKKAARKAAQAAPQAPSTPAAPPADPTPEPPKADASPDSVKAKKVKGPKHAATGALLRNTSLPRAALLGGGAAIAAGAAASGAFAGPKLKQAKSDYLSGKAHRDLTGA